MTTADATIRSRPVLFDGPMVRAILSGDKVVTRRPVVVATSDTAIWRHALSDLSRAWADHGFPTDENGDLLPIGRWGSNSPDPAPESCYRNHYLHVPFVHPEDGWEADPRDDTVGRVYCPLGTPGDNLYVRETARLSSMGGMGAKTEWVCVEYREPDPRTGVRVRTFHRDWMDAELGPLDFTKWTPSIHMPKWASRITLEITSVRVERPQDISVEDAKKEGLSQITKDNGVTWKWGIPDRDGLPGTDNYGWPWTDWEVDARKAFARLWDKTYGKTEHAWDRNPWAWVISFRRVETPV